MNCWVLQNTGKAGIICRPFLFRDNQLLRNVDRLDPAILDRITHLH